MAKGLKFQHTISEFFLSRFTIPNSSTIWNFNKVTNKVKPSNIDKASVIKDFYTANSLKGSLVIDEFFIERQFSKIEGLLKELFSRFDKFPSGVLNRSDGRDIAIGIAHFFVRSPGFRPDLIEIAHHQYVEDMKVVFDNDQKFQEWKRRQLDVGNRDTPESLDEERRAFRSGKYQATVDKDRLLQIMLKSQKTGSIRLTYQNLTRHSCDRQASAF